MFTYGITNKFPFLNIGIDHTLRTLTPFFCTERVDGWVNGCISFAFRALMFRALACQVSLETACETEHVACLKVQPCRM
jgi:hypothetical protein